MTVYQKNCKTYLRDCEARAALSEEDVKAALKEVKLALLEADVNFKVVKNFVKTVQEQAVGSDVLNGLNPGQTVIKIVNVEMVRLMGLRQQRSHFVRVVRQP